MLFKSDYWGLIVSDVCCRTALAVWRVILEETEKLAKARQQAAEIYMEMIAEPAKPLKSAKIQCHKKVNISAKVKCNIKIVNSSFCVENCSYVCTL